MEKNGQETAVEEKLVGEQGIGKPDQPVIKNYSKITTIKTEDLQSNKSLKRDSHVYRKLIYCREVRTDQ